MRNVIDENEDVASLDCWAFSRTFVLSFLFWQTTPSTFISRPKSVESEWSHVVQLPPRIMEGGRKPVTRNPIFETRYENEI